MMTENTFFKLFLQRRTCIQTFTVPVTMLLDVTLNSATMLLGLVQDTMRAVSVILLNIRSVGGSGPIGKHIGEIYY